MNLPEFICVNYRVESIVITITFKVHVLLPRRSDKVKTIYYNHSLVNEEFNIKDLNFDVIFFLRSPSSVKCT